MKLLSLLHMRTTCPPEKWGAFDAAENNAFTRTAHSKVAYNAKAVIMHGSGFGTLTDFDVGLAHTYAVAGFPCAHGVFFAQHISSIMLKTLVDNTINDASPSGCSQWSMMVAEGLRSSHDSALWGSYIHQPFTQPRGFDSGALLEQARSKLSLVEDEIELMQTSPEYMYRYAKEHKATRAFCAAVSAGARWEAIAWSIMSFWTDQLATWQIIVSETQVLHETIQHSGAEMRPGTHVPHEIAVATTICSRIVKQHLVRQCSGVLDLLLNVETIKEAYEKYSERGLPMGRKGVLDAKTDPFQRLVMATHSLQGFVRDESSRETSYTLQMMIDDLPASACNKTIDVHISSMALLDEFSRMMCCSQLGTSLDPIQEGAAIQEAERRGRLRLYVATEEQQSGAPSDHLTRSDQKLGKLLRSFCDAPPPKSSHGTNSLEKFLESRRRLSEFWKTIRDDWSEHQAREHACQGSVRGVLVKMSCDESSEYLSDVKQEHDRLETERQHLKGNKSQQKKPAEFVQQAWDTRTSATDPAHRKRTKAKAARDAKDSRLETESSTSELERLKLAEPKSDPEQVPQIPVKRDTLDVAGVLFGSTVGSSKRLRWPEFAQALTDAGMVATEGAGSAVNFACDRGSITFHKPHPEPILDFLMLRHFGKRLWRRFAWTEETFVLRKKSG